MIAGLYRNVLVAPENDTDARPRQTAKEQLSMREQAVHDTQEISKSAANNVLQEMVAEAANISQPAIEQAENKMEKNEAEPIRFLGNNHSHILILASDTQHAFLPEEHLALLIKMLEACKLNTGDTAIVNLATRPLTYPQLKDQLRPQKALFFGVGPDAIKMPVESALFHIGSFDDCLYVCAPSLGELNGNFAEAKALKARLWTSLQQLFLQKNPVPDA